MPTYRVHAISNLNGKEKTFLFRNYDNIHEVRTLFNETKSHYLTFNRIEEILETEPKHTKPSPSFRQRRAQHRNRIVSLRNNLQAFAEVEHLTHEERVIMCRIACQLTRLLSNFGARTIQQENGGGNLW
jgi:hypothetical protein